jgi:peroxiredoxin
LLERYRMPFMMYDIKSRVAKIIVIMGLVLGMWPHCTQGQLSPSSVVPIPNPATMILRSTLVLRELALNRSQIANMDASLNRAEMGLWQLLSESSEQRNPKALTIIRQLNKALASILSPFQIQRYQQILWQAQGIQAFMNPEVAVELDLAFDQKQLITSILTSLQTKLSQVSPGQLALPKQAQALAEKEVFSVLTPAQQYRWRALPGNSIDFSRVAQRAFKMPEFKTVNTWINTPSLTLSALKGKVTVVHFYTYGCINCIRNLPHYNDWHRRFSSKDLKVVGIHRPETPSEYSIATVKQKAVDAGIQYPVAIDNDAANWHAWGNRVWPSVYLVDKQGFVRYWWYGELNWQGTPGENRMRNRIEALLKE